MLGQDTMLGQTFDGTSSNVKHKHCLMMQIFILL